MSFITSFFKNWFRNLIVLLALARWYQGFTMPSGLVLELFASFCLTAINTFLNPIIKMIVLPFNIITMGMFTWLQEALTLLLLTLFIDEVSFRAFSYNDFSILGINIAHGQVQLFFAVILGSILYKLLSGLVKYLTN